MKRNRPKVGDLIEIPLSGNRKAFAQYVHWDAKVGPLIKVFDLVTHEPLDVLAAGASARPLFPPVITGLFAAVRSGIWKTIGHLPVSEFTYPGFVSTFWDQDTGLARDWFLWDGARSVRLGKDLPKEHRAKEYLVVWNPSDVVTRIETGQYPFPYGDLLTKGRFVPEQRSTSSE
jgi:hypothetical protein